MQKNGGFIGAINKKPYNTEIINNYNNELLRAKEANEDLQIVVDKFAKSAHEAGEDFTASMIRNSNATIVLSDSIQNMSLKAKIGKLALQGMALAGNMLVSWAASFAIGKVIQQKRLYRYSVKSPTTYTHSAGIPCSYPSYYY